MDIGLCLSVLLCFVLFLSSRGANVKVHNNSLRNVIP